MSPENWSQQSEWLNALNLAIQNNTHGLVNVLTVEPEPDGVAVVHGKVQSYHGVQLALQAIQQLSRQTSPFHDTRLTLTIDDETLEFVIANRHELSTEEELADFDQRHEPQLTGA